MADEKKESQKEEKSEKPDRHDKSGDQNRNENAKKSDAGKYFNTELKTTLLFAIIGIIMGYVSFIINYTSTAAVAAIVVFVVIFYGAKKIMHIQEEKKWWSTVGIVYFLLWLITWTVFYNVILLS